MFPFYVYYLFVMAFSIVLLLPFQFIIGLYLQPVEKLNIVKRSALRWETSNYHYKTVYLSLNIFLIFMSFYVYYAERDILSAFVLIIVLNILFLLAIIDWYIFRLPDILVLLNLLFLFFYHTLTGHNPNEALFGAVIGIACGLLIWIITKIIYGKSAFGFGDVKLMGILGLLYDWRLFVLIFLLGSVLAVFYGLVNISLKKLSWKSKIPLGSFLCLAAVIYLLFKDHFLYLLYYNV